MGSDTINTFFYKSCLTPLSVLSDPIVRLSAPEHQSRCDKRDLKIATAVAWDFLAIFRHANTAAEWSSRGMPRSEGKGRQCATMSPNICT